MKAIVKVSKSSPFAKHNGLTFEVKAVMSTVVALEISQRWRDEKMTMDFGFTEIMIVDFARELQKAYDDYNWGSDTNRYRNLQLYATLNGFYSPVEWNCPA
jgi:hypothetical protein